MPQAGLDLVGQLPQIARGDVRLYAVGAEGEIRSRCGEPEPVSFRVEDGQLVVEVAAERRVHFGHVRSSEEWLVLTYDAGDDVVFSPFFETLFKTLAEAEESRLDMESMSSSSLALMEEVAMMGEMLPQLPTGETEVEVVRMGLDALLVAASVDGALFVRLDDAQEVAEVLVHVRADAAGLGSIAAPITGQRIIDGGLAFRAMDGDGVAILESVPAGGRLGAPGSPESLARREVIAVPVRYGGETPVTLGALLLMDKRPNAYTTTDTFGSQDTKLATSVAAMLGSVLGTRKVTELGNEMRTAQTLQQQILPAASPHLPGFQLAGHSASSGVVGGDYYDFLPLPDGRLLCFIADVAGHNLASCMVMVSARAALRLLAATARDTAEVFDKLGCSLYSDLSRIESFITAAGATLEPATGALEIANAGHNPTMIFRRADGVIEELSGEDTVLGFLPAPAHDLQCTRLLPGDVMVLYTDGVTEASDAAGEFFGEERLRTVIRESVEGSAESILAAVFGAVTTFADTSTKGDDISVVVVKATQRTQGT